MASPNWADDIMGKDIAYNGAVQNPRRKILNFLPGSGISITVADNMGLGSTDVTITSNGSLTGGVDYKDAVRAATTANITLSALQTIDGVVLATGDRVLVWQQTTSSQNGIYVASAGAWTRATDANTSPLVTSGLIVPVSEGTLYTKASFKLTTINPIVLGTTGLVFERQPRTLDDVLSLGNVASINPVVTADAQYIQLGQTAPALSGSIRLRGSSNGLIRWRNAANTGDFGIEATVGDTLLVGGGTVGFPSIRLETPTLTHTTGGALNWQSYQLFPNMPAILLDPACGNGTGANCFIGANTAATARAGMSMYMIGGGGGTGNQNGGDLVLGAGLASGTGIRGSVKFIDDLGAQTLLMQVANDATPRVEVFVPKLRFGISVAAPIIGQANQTANSANGQTLTIQSQSSTGTTTIGGHLVFQSGTGTTTAGDIAFYCGATQVGYFSTNATSRFAVLVPGITYDIGVTSPIVSQSNQTAASTNGQALTVQAQNATGLTSTGGALKLASGTGTTIAGDVTVSVGTAQYALFSATSSLPRLELGVPTLRFGSGVATPSITQTTQTVGSGVNLTIQSQSSSDVTSVGGSLILASGTGTTSAGNVVIKSGATQIAQATTATFEVSTGAWLNIVKGQALGAGGVATLGATGGSGPTTVAQNKWVEIKSNGTTVWIPAWI